MYTYQPLPDLSRALRRRRGFNCYAENQEALVIRTGMTVVVAGYEISMERDEALKVATVTVRRISDEPVVGSHRTAQQTADAVKVAADLFAGRAQRTLGMDWRVVAWQPNRRPAGD